MSIEPNPNPKSNTTNTTNTTNTSSEQVSLEKSESVSRENFSHASGWFDQLILLSIKLRGWIILVMLGLVALGIYSYQKLPIDAVPDITNIQVQINTQAMGFTAPEVEQRITYPIETVMAGLPDLQQTRSISRYGLSQVTVIFNEGTDIYWARQLISQRLQEARGQLPSDIEPIMAPVSTGLGEIYQWVLKVDERARKPDGTPYSLTDLRELQDWVVRPQVQQVAGVAEVNSIGGYQKQYVVEPDFTAMQRYGIGLQDLKQVLENSNENRGAGIISQQGQQLSVRIPGQLVSIADIQQVVIPTTNFGRVVHVADVATVLLGQEIRSGAATLNGQETVLGTAMMLTGANSRQVAQAVDAKIQQVQQSLPKGVARDGV